ncbi:MAG: 4-hydroxythreonine-4-phosphate dehydrogenase PdxA, partial [Candidatus Omnitrophica bacterium]|nr:4-hydroxythreonine-4-phosphate dehydrogenase PdxA [Candidatus Omnitrophota bacterium]
HWVYRKYCLNNYRNCSFVDLKSIQPKQWKIGKPNLASAKASLNALQEGVDLLKSKAIDGLVTAPLSKEPISRILPSFQGHTEFLADAFGIKNVGMMFVAGKVRTIIVTRHIPLNQVCKAVNPANIYDTIDLTHRALRNLFKIKKPVIGVCGVNPHAGEEGTMGREEITKVIPAIKKARRRKMNVEGPFAADTLFSPDIAHHYDAIVAMYHDQGLIPVKTLCFKELVNLTIGLPFIRTSPAHGTAFNIAGAHKADPSSMPAAIKLAVELIL